MLVSYQQTETQWLLLASCLYSFCFQMPCFLSSCSDKKLYQEPTLCYGFSTFPIPIIISCFHTANNNSSIYL